MLTVFETTYAEVWPLGSGSVQGLYPRNLRIAQLEDQLLQHTRKLTEIDLHASSGDVPQALGQTPVLVIADGAHSSTRQELHTHLGMAMESLSRLADERVEESCLGLAIRTSLSDAAAVVLSTSQRRRRLNRLHGEGHLNIRLTAAEASGLLHAFKLLPGDGGADTPRRINLGELRSTNLWPRLEEELILFAVDTSRIRSCNWFRLAMAHQHRFVAPLLEANRAQWRTYGCLIGDAATALHIWPGRSINTGGGRRRFAGSVSGEAVARCRPATRRLSRCRLHPPRGRDADAAIPAQVGCLTGHGHSGWGRRYGADPEPPRSLPGRARPQSHGGFRSEDLPPDAAPGAWTAGSPPAQPVLPRPGAPPPCSEPLRDQHRMEQIVDDNDHERSPVASRSWCSLSRST